MSLQQQCLPLPRRRKRHVYNQNNNDKDEDGDSNRYNKNNNQSSSMDTTDNNNETPQQISDLSEMDASTYLASVSAQASNLPFVFTAPAKVKVKEDSLGGGEKYETTIERKEQGKNDQREEAMWQGSATSVQYLFSQRLKLVPPPSIHYLPPVVVNAATTATTATNDNDNANDYSQSMQEYSQFVMNNFSKLRLYLHQCRNGNGNSKSSGNGTTILQERKIPVPPSKDSYNWHIFCLGKNEARGNIGGYYDVSSSSSSSEDEDEDKNENQNEKDCKWI
jgi:hypothetical protein